MSFIGTFGCMLMLVASFGMNQTMDNFMDTFYDGTAAYSSKIFMSSDAKNSDAVKLAEDLDGDYSASQVPVGIDVSDSLLVTKYNLYENDCVLGIGAYTKRPENVKSFLAFILQEGS